MGLSPLSSDSAKLLAVDSRDKLALWLGLSDRKLRYILYKLSSADKYSRFSIKKRNGGERIIDAPKEYLKRLQQKLALAIQEIAPATGIAKGFVRGRSIFDHASRHRGRRWVIVADLADFFPSINFGRVLGAFKAKPFEFSTPVATCLAQLCCNEGVLPQGAPTSPSLSNLICRSLDRSLVNLSKASRASVTRYGDDICFSTNIRDIPDTLAKLKDDGSWGPSERLEKLIAANGFSLNARKFKVRSSRDRQLVTGLVVNRNVQAPRYWRRQLRVVLNLYRKRGEVEALKVVSSWTRGGLRNRVVAKVENLIRGKASYAKWLDNRGGGRFTESLHRGYPTLKVLLPRIGSGYSFRIMTEGDTDAVHLHAALMHFQRRDLFTQLRPRFENYRGDKGDVDLMETLRRIAKANIDEIVVGVFDCDNEVLMRQYGAVPGSVVRLGQKVVALFLAEPHAEVGKFCIECLYERAEATRETGDERRLFFGDEFDSHTGIDKTAMYKRDKPKSASIVVSDQVTRISDGKSCLLSKAEFAKLVASGASPFSDIRFDGFRGTLARLVSIFDTPEAIAAPAFHSSSKATGKVVNSKGKAPGQSIPAPLKSRLISTLCQTLLFAKKFFTRLLTTQKKRARK